MLDMNPQTKKLLIYVKELYFESKQIIFTNNQLAALLKHKYGFNYNQINAMSSYLINIGIFKLTKKVKQNKFYNLDLITLGNLLGSIELISEGEKLQSKTKEAEKAEVFEYLKRNEVDQEHYKQKLDHEGGI